MMKFCFGDIVVVEDYLIGVVVKCWKNYEKGMDYDVYVRNFNAIKNYSENDIHRYMVRHKELNDEEMYYQKNIENGL